MARAAVTSSGAARRPACSGANRGAAVILAMLLAALAATIAATLFADQQRWTRAVLQRRDQVQAQALVMAGVQWARQILHGDGREKRIDHLGEPWAAALPPIPLENGEIRGAITDATGRLNVNAIDGSGSAADSQRDSIERLFAQRGGPGGAIDAIADWIDADGAVRPNGAEDAFYAEQGVPGLAANGPIVRIAELSAVRGVSLPALAAVSPFLTALPPGTPVNVNTAPPEVLAAILQDARGDTVAALVARRAERPFNDVADFRARVPQGATLLSESSLAVRSDYFYVSVEARQGTTVARARALLRRGGPGKALPVVVWQVVE
jgi:general secretion pathway protein K